MGTKYSTVSVASYNSSPPADDGSTTETNKVKWSTVKTKLADPVKTAVEAINTALVDALDQSASSKTADYNTVAADHNKAIEIAAAASSGITVSLGDAATMAAGYTVTVANQSTHTQTVGRVTGGDTIDGVAGNVSIRPKSSMTFAVNASANGYNRLSASGDAGLILLSAQSASTSSSIDFTGLDSTYERYVVLIENVVPSTTGQILGVRVGTGGSPTYQTTNYNYGMMGVGTSGTVTGEGNTSQSSIPLSFSGGGITSGAGESGSYRIEVTNPAGSSFKIIKADGTYFNSSTNPVNVSVAGAWMSTTAVTALRFFFTGNIASGSFRLYGVRKS